MLLPDKGVGILTAVRSDIDAEAVEVCVRSFMVRVQRKDDPVSADCLNSGVVHHHCNVQITVMSTGKQFSQLMRQACVVVQIKLIADIFGEFRA